jgi:hypothetical protein
MAKFDPQKHWEKLEQQRRTRSMYYDAATGSQIVVDGLGRRVRGGAMDEYGGLKDYITAATEEAKERELRDRIEEEGREARLAYELAERKMLERARDMMVKRMKEHGHYFPIPEGDAAIPVYTIAPPTPTTVHKAGHFPTNWMEEAVERAENSEKMVTITVERGGVAVTAIEGNDKFAGHTISWVMMEKAEVNPLLLAIEDVERKLDLLHKMKETIA